VKRAALALVCLVAAGEAGAATRWITDEFTVPLRSGASSGHRIVHRGLASGTPLEVIGNEENGFVRVRADNGVEGWVESHYLVAGPIARIRLEAATKRIASLEAMLAEETSVTLDRETLAAQVAALEAEIAELKSLSATAVEAHARNSTLAELNTRLRAEIDALNAERNALRASHDQRGLWIGGGLALAGLLAGVLLKARPRRSGWS
jgi:SH3 domain protein